MAYTVDVDEIVEKQHLNRNQVILSLEKAEEQGYIILEASQIRKRVKRTKNVTDAELDSIIESLYQGSLEKQQRELNRVQQVLDLFKAERCLFRMLSEYFGKELHKDCGQCSWCKDKSQVVISKPVPKPAVLDHPTKRAFQACLNRGVTDARTMTKFALGITSPALTWAKLTTTHELFGALEGTSVEFNELAKLAEQYSAQFASTSGPSSLPILSAMEMQKMSVAGLKEELRKRVQPVTGTRAELIKRLNEYFSSLTK